MSLSDRLKTGAQKSGPNLRKEFYEKYGVARNPFPPAGEPSDHPHKETAAEELIITGIKTFERDHTSQVFLIEGTQGVGKTNLLNYFQSELQAYYSDSEDFYIIRYYPDPEASFDGIIRRLFQEFHQVGLLARMALSLAALPDTKKQEVIDIAFSHEIRLVLSKLATASAESEEQLRSVCELAFEWLSGLRVLNKHREALGIHFRLDSVESKTQALRDLVFCSSRLNLFKGIFLLLDELEKQDYSLSKTVVLRFLSAIRALIDALPQHLFLLVALTIEARRRYFSMLPALAGRLQNAVELKPIKSAEEALEIAHFYVGEAKNRAAQDLGGSNKKPGTSPLLKDSEIRELFQQSLRRASERAQEGVTQRDFLNSLHFAVEKIFAIHTP
jgi:GTPase SAR1 family protein